MDFAESVEGSATIEAPTPQHSHDHSHAGLFAVSEVIQNLSVSDSVKKDAIAVYETLAKAESAVHGIPMEHIHFHEVGTLDAIADIVGVCLLFSLLNPDKVVASPVHVGSGFVHTMHGILPVPAPATARLLQGIPTYAKDIKGELCTPTGAALLKHFASSFGPMPTMIVEKIGYGMGTKDFPIANCLRAFLGETEEGRSTGDSIVELKCNIDDMTGEQLGYATGVLLDAGALDVFLVPIQMKKSRPGTLLIVLCQPEKADYYSSLLLEHTTTFGVRKTECSRTILEREFQSVETGRGSVKFKTGVLGSIRKSKPEYEDLAKIAHRANLPIAEVAQDAMIAFEKEKQA
jgi:uncharacterized protein (TIGR00299 family) protein